MRIRVFGHRNITGTHRTTIEVTTAPHLTTRGTCIIGVRASHSLSDLKEKLIPVRECNVRVVFTARSITDEITGFVHPSLKFTDKEAIIFRKSSFLCPRTLLIRSSKAAGDLKRELIKKMRDPCQEMVIDIQKL